MDVRVTDDGADSLPLDDTWLKMCRGETLSVDATVGPTAADLAQRFDYAASGHESFQSWRKPQTPSEFGIGLIVGGSGTGKSTLLSEYGQPNSPHWTQAPIADHFADADQAQAAFLAVGLSSVPTWMKPYGVLSTGERFRADLARTVGHGAVIDEYTSVVDRVVAASASRSLRRAVDAGRASQIVLATCHRDVIEHLLPDWIIDTDSGLFSVRPRECLHWSPVVVDVYEVNRGMWAHFRDHHYLNGDLHPFARCYIAALHGTPVAFAAAIPFPHASIRNGWRGHRVVTLPDYQGLGIGPRLADWVAEAHHRSGYRYYAKTTHARLGGYRDQAPWWEATSHNRRTKHTPRKSPVSFATRRDNAWIGSQRVSYSHRYIGGFGVSA